LSERAYAAALVSVVQQTTASIGDAVLSDAHRENTRERLDDAATATLDHLATRWHREHIDRTRLGEPSAVGAETPAP
jgi:hypothetical protein